MKENDQIDKSKLNQLNVQVDEIVFTMMENAKRVVERGQTRLNELTERAEALEQQANIFVKCQPCQPRMKKKAKFRAAKWTWILAGICCIFIAVISGIMFS